MGGAGASARVRVQPAWRAASSDEEARAFLQRRLATFSGVLFAALLALHVYIAVVYEAYPDLLPRWKRELIYASAAGGLVMLAAIWRLALARSALTERVLYRLDAFYAVMIGAGFGGAALLSYERRASGYAVLIQMILVVFTRAFLVPSTGRRTAIIGAVAFCPLIIAAIGRPFLAPQDIPGPPYAVAALTLCGVAVLLATLGSRLIYGLQRQVSAATQLGQYTLEAKIGEGGMGTVYRGHHVMLRRPTAIKLLRADRIGANTVDRFEREVQHTSQLAHPNTVAVFDYGRTGDGVFYYAMELLDGMDLEQVVRKHGPLPPGRTIEILIQVCGALQEAHERGIVHRDIKPANVILCEHGGVPDIAKVVDFGLVKELTQDALTTNENIVGTPAYVAPETITDPSAISAAADLYALGAVGYFLLSGRRVFEGANVVDICIQHVTAEPKPLSQSALHVPAELEAVIMRCLRKKPQERFASATAVAEALRAIDTADWSEQAALAWWAERRDARHATPSATLPTQTITIDMEHRA
jgi:serine/threonine-protein kinase